MRGAERKEWTALTLTAAVVLVVRLAFAGTHAESWDAVDFALALERYDIRDMQPHFPGYPLYIAAAHLFLPWVQDPVRALTWLSAFAGSLSVVVMFLLAKRLTGHSPTAWIAALLLAANPLTALTHVQPMSESLGLLGALLFFAGCARALEAPREKLAAWTCLTAALFALLLGIRLSYFPLGIALLLPLWRLVRERRTLPGIAGQAGLAALAWSGGMALWIAPAALSEGGLLPYLELGQAFTVGHFTEWGGTPFSSEAGVGQRITVWMQDRLLFNGLLGISALGALSPLEQSGAIAVTAFLLVLFIAGWRPLRRNHPQLFQLAGWTALPYAVWLLVGQNSEKARHILPLLPWMLLWLSCGWTRLVQLVKRHLGSTGMQAHPAVVTRTAFAVLSVAGMFTLSFLVVRQVAVLAQHTAPPPALQLVRFVEHHFPADATRIYTWEEQRLFDYYARRYETERVRSWDYFRQSILLYADTRRHLLLTNAVLDGFGPDHPLRAQVTEVARFEADPFLYPTYHTVELYELDPDAVPAIREGRM